jgi:diguanylate cyclase
MARDMGLLSSRPSGRSPRWYDEDPAAADTAAGEKTSAGGPHRPSLVIVEDDEADLGTLSHHLARLDLKEPIVSFRTCAEARAHLAGDPPDAVLLDLGLPDSTGLATLAAIRAATPDSAIVVLAGADEDWLALRAVQMGAQEVLSKPALQPHTLQRALWLALERKRQEQALARLSRTDTLTGLANRLMLHEQLRQTVARARRRGEKFGVLFIDLDGFRAINQAHGHQAGDAVIIEIGRRLKRQLREYDTVARLEGDEFAVLLENVDSPRLLADLARRLIALVAAPIDVGPCALEVGASVGIAVYPSSGGTVEQLLRAADSAMNEAKREGRRSYRFFDPRSVLRGESGDEMIERIREAIDRREFQLYFQPQIDFASGELWGFEALLRWHRPDGVVVLPGDFMPLLQGTPLLQELGEWVIWQVCCVLQRWEEEGRPPVRVGINLSLPQLASPEFLAGVAYCLGLSGVSPSRLEFEIPHEVLSRDLDRSRALVSKLRNIGVGVAVDNFGAAPASLACLEDLGVDTIKIDRALVARMGRDGGDRQLAAGICAMAAPLRIEVVAGGIESMGQMQSLREVGCHRGQGFYLGIPRPDWALPIAAE